MKHFAKTIKNAIHGHPRARVQNSYLKAKHVPTSVSLAILTSSRRSSTVTSWVSFVGGDTSRVRLGKKRPVWKQRMSLYITDSLKWVLRDAIRGRPPTTQSWRTRSTSRKNENLKKEEERSTLVSWSSHWIHGSPKEQQKVAHHASFTFR